MSDELAALVEYRLEQAQGRGNLGTSNALRSHGDGVSPRR
jgi:hypothetical protein